MQVVAIFESARNVIKAEQICRDAHLSTHVIPLPEHLSSECGMCLVFDHQQIETIKQLMVDAKINITIHNNG